MSETTSKTRWFGIALLTAMLLVLPLASSASAVMITKRVGPTNPSSCDTVSSDSFGCTFTCHIGGTITVNGSGDGEYRAWATCGGTEITSCSGDGSTCEGSATNEKASTQGKCKVSGNDASATCSSNPPVDLNALIAIKHGTALDAFTEEQAA